MAQVALVTDKGCLSGSGLIEGAVGQVLVQGVDGPAWAPSASSGTDVCDMTAAEVTCLVEGFDFSQMTVGQITTLMGALDFSQLTQAQLDEILTNIDISNLTAAQVATLSSALSAALRGELVQDAFGVELGYLLPL